MRSFTFVPSPVNVLTLAADASVPVFASTGTLRWLAKVEDVAENKRGKAAAFLTFVDGIQDVRKDVQVTSSSLSSS